jgi:hypothetical protein
MNRTIQMASQIVAARHNLASHLDSYTQRSCFSQIVSTATTNVLQVLYQVLNSCKFLKNTFTHHSAYVLELNG